MGRRDKEELDINPALVGISAQQETEYICLDNGSKRAVLSC